MPHYIRLLKASYAVSVLYPLAAALPKLSICALYLPLFKVNPGFRRATIGMIGFLAMNAVAWLVPTIVVCHPISAYWDPEGHQGRCINYNVFGTWISLPNILSDLILMGLPMPVLWLLNMSTAKKLGVIATLAVGSA